MKKPSSHQPTLALAVGAALSIGVPAAHAEGNPFAMQKLQQGYMVADASDKAASGAKPQEATAAAEKKNTTDKGKVKKADAKKKATPAKAAEGKCGEGKCGAKMNMPAPK